MSGVTATTALLNEPQRLVLKAVTRSGQDAVEAFRRWRALVLFDDIDYSTFRVVPLLVALVKREGLDDPDLQRMKGIERHVWAANTLRFKQLFLALTAIRRANVRFVLMKGAALQARTPEIAALRMSGDYDVLVDPLGLPAIRRELEAAGFGSSRFDLKDWDDDLPRSSMAGASVSLADSTIEVDIHWRALPYLHDAALTERILASAEEGTLGQASVPVPSIAHQLFTCLARCEPWDKGECMTRLLEAYFLLRGGDANVDWRELEELISRYRMKAWASAFFDELIVATGIAIPAAVRKGPSSFLLRKEWKIRSIATYKRTHLQRWLLQYNDARFSRRSPSDWRLTWREALLATRNKDGRNLMALWRSVSQRATLRQEDRIDYLYGFSTPEKWLRWTEGNLAFAVIPLNDEQKKGAPVEIRGHVLNTGRPTRIVMEGGWGNQELEIPKEETQTTLSVRLRSLASLDGNGLLALWLPDAGSPTELGIGRDDRWLSFAVHRI